MENKSLEPIRVERWPTETPFTVLVAFFAASIWLLLAFTIIGAVYALLIFVAVYLGHIGFIAHIRGSAVKISPEQFPDLHQAIVTLSQRIGFETIPDAYVMQAGGALNAFATKFFKANLLILYSDLLEACGENTEARDMIIAHELGHLKEGHLKWHWFLLPGMVYPFIGQALSRAREYTCDRYGYAAVSNKENALRGLAILAAGAKRGPEVNLLAMAHQSRDLNTGWLTIGQWLASHPPLAKRLIALEKSLAPSENYTQDGVIKALALIAVVYILPIFLVIMGVIGFSLLSLKNLPHKKEKEVLTSQSKSKADSETPELFQNRKKAKEDILALAKFVEEEWKETNKFPEDINELYDKWNEKHPENYEPKDPFTQKAYHYMTFEDGKNYEIWSNGPDGKKLTSDDIYTTHKTMNK